MHILYSTHYVYSPFSELQPSQFAVLVVDRGRGDTVRFIPKFSKRDRVQRLQYKPGDWRSQKICKGVQAPKESSIVAMCQYRPVI